MSIARHHAEWLSLVPVSGPFLSLPVLMEAFNTGLEPHDPDQSRLLRQEYGNWQASFEQRKADPAPYQHWIKFVLTNTLELDEGVLADGQAIPQTLQVEVPEHHELLRPSIVLIDPNTKKPRLLVQTYPRSQELTSYVVNSRWKASPDTRMTELLHATGVRLGLVTNGEHWMLVDAAKGETTGYSSWYASLWLEEPITLRAFRSLLSASRFFNVSDDQTLEALLTKSASNQQEVTDQLGYQVRRAVEVLIHSLDRADQDFGRELLVDVREEVLYEAALTVMMRLVFLFCAEERELIPSKPFPVYEQNYSVSAISKQLRELADQHGEELLERRYDAWPRLLASFRAVYGGLQHDDVHIPAYGGTLFAPDRFPFLEGRKLGTSWKDTEANPLPVNNRTVLHLLEALQLLQIKVPGGGPAEARRLSFRALDIEQIGHVYEGLLDHTAKRATEPFLGLAGTRDKEPELPLADLEKLLAKGEADLVEFLKDEMGKSDKALTKSLHAEIDPPDASRFRTACQGDDVLWKRVKPLAGLVRPDSFGYPVVIPKGSVFVTAGTDRRSSGTHYTPRSLTEPIVQYTLEPLVYVGPAEGKPKSEWKLKSAKELLELKICDMACGSGAFLVQAARYMSERLLEAWDAVKHANPNAPGVTPQGTPSTGKANEILIPDDPAERKTYAMRIIAQRCLYGVDKNPLATEMAKLSLWLLTLAKDKPFEFLDHSIRCGDSLVGLHELEQLKHFSLKPDADDAVLFRGPLDTAVDEAVSLRLQVAELQASSLEDVKTQVRLYRQANEKIARLRYAADLLVAAEFWGESAKVKLEQVRHAAVVSGHYVEKGPTEEFGQVAAKERKGQTMFHWPLEFPEVIVKRGGFDAFVGNPPFLGCKYFKPVLGEAYFSFLSVSVDRKPGRADLCSFFFQRADTLLNSLGCVGLVATNTIAQGDTQSLALAPLSQPSPRIYRSALEVQWPGSAAVSINTIHWSKNPTQQQANLNGQDCAVISEFLTESALSKPSTLPGMLGRCFQGSIPNAAGLILECEEASALLQASPHESDVVKPYLNDITDDPEAVAKKWCVFFRNMTESEARQYPLSYRRCEELVRPVKVAKGGASAKYWWRFYRYSPDLYEAIANLERVFVTTLVSKYLTLSSVASNHVFSNKLGVFAEESWAFFSVIQSTLHETWARQFSTTLETRLSYTPTDCFETFPLPHSLACLEFVGERYNAFRSGIMLDCQDGLTKTYNRFHDSDETSTDIHKLRELHVEMDQAVAAAYGWTDLDLGHDIHETKQGGRFTISEPARREVLQRLLKLNHERYAEEVKQELHSKKGAAKKAAPKKKAASRSTKQEVSLFDGEDDE
jgi:Eco57I restriction-modification methylase/restriction-modification enzyme MmeI-like protein